MIAVFNDYFKPSPNLVVYNYQKLKENLEAWTCLFHKYFYTAGALKLLLQYNYVNLQI
jgi:hypothetical protein